MLSELLQTEAAKTRRTAILTGAIEQNPFLMNINEQNFRARMTVPSILNCPWITNHISCYAGVTYCVQSNGMCFL